MHLAMSIITFPIMSNTAFSGILQGSLTVTFLDQQHGYYYRTNATTEYKSSASCSCKDHSNPMESVEEREGNFVNFCPRRCYIAYTRMSHMRLVCHEYDVCRDAQGNGSICHVHLSSVCMHVCS